MGSLSLLESFKTNFLTSWNQNEIASQADFSEISKIFASDDGINPIIGADTGEIKELLFLCNPYERKCLFDAYGPYNKRLAVVAHFLAAAANLYLQRRDWRKV